MSCYVKLKNSDSFVIVDEPIAEFLIQDPKLKCYKFLSNLRKHSAGYAFFQKYNKTTKNYITLYLHKVIAEMFIVKPVSEKKLYVSFKNGNQLDCRLGNLEWLPFSKVVRNTAKCKNKLGYRGVVKERNKYRAVIFNENRAIHIGMFNSIEEAATAYNVKSFELFGYTRSLNEIKKKQ